MTGEEGTPEMKPANAVVDKEGGGGGGSSSGSGNGGGGGDGNRPSEGEAEEAEFQDLYYYINITQSISWLKDMYEATLIVYNNANSQTIVARDLTTRLILPSGLSLAGTYFGQSEEKKLKDLRGGESDSATWYVRGDTPGSYQLQALLTGTLQPFHATLPAILYPMNLM